MNYKILKINEAHVTREPVYYTCYGLGSCVSVFITDRLKRLAGGAHIPLPSGSQSSKNFAKADQLISHLIEQFKQKGSNLETLRAKITGGAQVMELSMELGKKNVESVKDLLIAHKIFIASQDVGGKISRTARFNSQTGELHISTSEGKKYYV
jgi:chemotaxis protein CheD